MRHKQENYRSVNRFIAFYQSAEEERMAQQTEQFNRQMAQQNKQFKAQLDALGGNWGSLLRI